jgi:hypothetical protein
MDNFWKSLQPNGLPQRYYRQLLVKRPFCNWPTEEEEETGLANLRARFPDAHRRPRMKIGDRLPATEEMARQYYGINVSTVTPANYYLLDTPVFDDISITYFTKPLV